MKEVLAVRTKRQFLLFVLVGAVCGALCIGMNFLYPSFRILYIAGACVFFLAMLFGVVGLCMPRTVAEREGGRARPALGPAHKTHPRFRPSFLRCTRKGRRRQGRTRHCLLSRRRAGEAARPSERRGQGGGACPSPRAPARKEEVKSTTRTPGNTPGVFYARRDLTAERRKKKNDKAMPQTSCAGREGKAQKGV